MSMFPQCIGAGMRTALVAVVMTVGLTYAPLLSAQGQVPALRAYAATERARPVAPHLPRSAFLHQPSRTAVTLSADGQQLAWLQDTGQGREVWWRPGAGGKAKRLLASTAAQSLSWTRDARWLLLRSPREVFALATAGQSGSGIVTSLGGADRRELLDVDASQPAAVIVLERIGSTPRGEVASWRLLRVDVSGRRSLLWQDKQRISGYALDASGQLRWLQRVEGLALVIHRVDADGHLHAVTRCEHARRCSLLATTSDGGVWMRSDLDGDLNGLLQLEADGRLHSVHRDPHAVADIDDIVFDPYSQQPLLVAYRSAAPAIYALDAADAAHLAAIQRRLPGRDLQIEVGRGTQPRWLVREGGDSLQGHRWSLYDPRRDALEVLFDDAPLARRGGRATAHVAESAMARALPVSWRASDGLPLHGLLWLPPGRDPALVPMVVNVHGGPWNHFKPEFRAATQFLINRGYAVFEPNFRGSTGYGRHHVFAADGDFGNGRVQLDIVEGTRWLLANGIGDGQRVGITGASFGGYSTLLGTTFQPDLFKVGVAMVPPPDFAWTLRWILRNPESLQIGNVVPMADWLRMLSLDPMDAAHMSRLHAQSPLANAAQMHRPLLLVAGGEDQRVGIAGVVEYAARLKLAGADASLLVDAQAGHSGGDALARETYLFALETLLHAHLGGDAPDPPDGQMRSWLRANLRMAGKDLRPYAAPQGL